MDLLSLIWNVSYVDNFIKMSVVSARATKRLIC